MNSVDVWKIIQKMKTITDITDIVWQNIFYWAPIKSSDIDKDIYIIINEITEIPDFSQRNTRLEFRYLGNNDSVKKTSLKNICWIVTDSLSFDSCNWVQDFDWFKVSSFIEWNSAWPFRDDKDRNLLIKDYIVTFFKDD